jgi:hypothetical protein
VTTAGTTAEFSLGAAIMLPSGGVGVIGVGVVGVLVVGIGVDGALVLDEPGA